MFGRIAGAALAVALATPGVASAQDSRAASLEKQRADKAAALQPYRPGKLERALLYVEREDPLRKIAPHNGFFVSYGYTWKPVGSGIGVGVGFRHDLFERHARMSVEVGGTLRSYWMVSGDFALPSLAGGRLELGVSAVDRHNPQEDFFGLGATSIEDNRVSFLLDDRRFEGRAVVKPGGGLQIGVRTGRLSPKIGTGTDERFPSIEEVYRDSDAPGLTVQPDFSYHDVFALVDRRDQPGNPRGGGLYAVTWRRYSDQDFDRYSFGVFEADLQHFFPIFDKKRVFAVRGRLVTTDADAGQVVPFYLRPTLGGSESLRSVRDFRFRDTNMLALNIEYRWEAFSGLDMALFTDHGKVASSRSDLDLTDLEHAYGIGFRFNTYKDVFFRVDMALAGAEAPKFFFKFSKAF